MDPQNTVTVFDPQGTPRAIPANQVDTALQAGGQRAVKMQDPSGTQRWIPESKVQDAQSAGGKVVGGGGIGESFADSSGLSLLGHVLAHPIDSAATVVDAARRVVAPNQPAKMSDNPNPIISGIGRMVDNTVDNVKKGVADYKQQGLSLQTRRDFGNAIPFVGPSLQTAEEQSDAGNNSGAMGTMLGIGAGVVGPAVLKEAKNLPGKVVPAVTRVLAGDRMDTPIPGDTATPRDVYTAAKGMGVNLDAAQATGSPATNAAKAVSQHSLTGSGDFHANKVANTTALYTHVENLLDQTAPANVDRETFGNTAKAALLDDQVAQNARAGQLYDELSAEVGDKQPDVSGVRAVAQRILTENEDYYAKHPEMLKGGARSAWGIVQDLAKEPADDSAPLNTVDALQSKWGITPAEEQTAAIPDTWSDLHKMRSDLLDISRGPEFIGDRPTGWIKQLTGAVDNAMTDAGSGLDGEAAQKFRDAGDLYGRMKATYDDPKSKLYHVVRSPGGTQAANLLANMTPELARQVATAAPELVPQLQRQTMSRLFSKPGNEVPDLETFWKRYKDTPKEQLRGVLSPSQIQQMEDVARVSRAVFADSNPSGTAKVGQKYIEASSLVGGVGRAGLGLVSANPTMVLEGVAPLAEAAGTKVAAKTLNNPKFTAKLMQRPAKSVPAAAAPFKPSVAAPAAASAQQIPQKGQKAWVQLGAAKVLDHLGRDASSGLTADDVSALQETPQGRQLLIKAGDLNPGSAAMKDVVRRAHSVRGS